mgnify:CR=1 FL=1
MSPQMAPHPCSQQGCPNLVAPGEGRYCPEHARVHQQQYDAQRGTSAKRGYGARWRKIRARKLARDPLCEDPYGVHGTGGAVVEATEVDHIVPKRDGGSDRMENLQSLCKSCHSRKTALEDGRWG